MRKPSRSNVATHSGTAAIAAVVVSALIGIGATASKTSQVQVIYVQDKSTLVSVAELKNALPAFQAALSKDFAPLWHVDAKLVYLPRATPVPAGAESITLVDKGNVKGALAYHEMVDGVADSIIYVGVSKLYGYSWTVGFTHELWEMLADAPAGAGAVDTMQSPDGTIWAKEIADPCEADSDGYTRPGADGKPVLISDFVTERWFGAEQLGPYDFMNHIQAALVILKGGYAQWWDGATWNMVNNFRPGGLGTDAFYL